MSDKTVAERLREKPNGSSLECYAAVTMMGVSCRDMESCMACYNKTAEMLADAIEQERTKTEYDGVDVDALLNLADHLTVRTSYDPQGDKLIADRIRKAVKGANASKSMPLPDGVEWPRYESGELVRFGDVAKVRDDIGEVIEIRFHTGKCSEVTIAFEGESTATHYVVVDGPHLKRPEPEVLDADGVPIKVGDTVYHEVDGSELTVVGLRDEKEDGEVMVDVEGKWACVRQFSVTHRKPDTQEAIDADAAKTPCAYFGAEKANRCAECPQGNGDDDTDYALCRTNMTHDLLRRQRKLLGGE